MKKMLRKSGKNGQWKRRISKNLKKMGRWLLLQRHTNYKLVPKEVLNRVLIKVQPLKAYISLEVFLMMWIYKFHINVSIGAYTALHQGFSSSFYHTIGKSLRDWGEKREKGDGT